MFGTHILGHCYWEFSLIDITAKAQHMFFFAIKMSLIQRGLHNTTYSKALLHNFIC